ncbi:MAG: hypothetical protein RL480_1938, partial [Pseudomonadota bacterium]
MLLDRIVAVTLIVMAGLAGIDAVLP